MFKFIRRAFCAHNFVWSERRKGEVCIHCGRFRADPAPPTDRAA